MKKFSRGLKKHIRREKTRIRKDVEEKGEQKSKIKELISRFKRTEKKV